MPASEVRVHVVRGDRTEVGTRVTFVRGAQEMSATVDIMGDAHLAFPAGTWSVLKPEGATPSKFEVTAATTQVTLVFPVVFALRVRVVDAKDQPIPGAAVEVIGEFSQGLDQVTFQTDQEGRVAIAVRGPRVLVRGTSGGERSRFWGLELPAAEVKLIIAAHSG